MSATLAPMKPETHEGTDPARPRLILDVDQELREAIELACLQESLRRRRRVGKSELIVPMLRNLFASQIDQVREQPSEEPLPGKKRGRKRKQEGGDE